MHDFRKLRVWEDAMSLAVAVYSMTRAMPSNERFGLAAQMRSAAVSVSSNIAEGAGRGGSKELARFLRIALGSLAELDSQLELAVRLGILAPSAEISDRILELRRSLLRFHDKLMGIRP